MSGGIQISDSAFVNLVSACPHLQTVKINECTEIKDDGIKALTQCTGLKTVSLRDLKKATTSAFDEEFRRCYQLDQRASICQVVSSLIDVTIATIADNCPRLHTLDLTNCF